MVELPKGGYKRLSTLTPGMGFGEAALIAGGVRSADVRADSRWSAMRSPPTRSRVSSESDRG